jgi:outer membrane protein insertion porin family
VRFPLPFVPEDLGLSGAFFVDAGSLFGLSNSVKALSGQFDSISGTTTQIVDDKKIRVSAGTSLLWNSPLGPLRADFGWAILKQDYDKEQLFRFGASTKF